MKIEAVTTSVGYSDFLAETLPYNKILFDRLVVVTSPEDVETQKVCEYNHVECVQTDVFDGGPDAPFRKGAGINVGLARLDLDGWVVHLDADVALPPESRKILEYVELDKQGLYGVDRMNVVGYKAWYEHKLHPKLQHEDGVYVHLDGFPLGTRFIWPDGRGYVPIGFFQMWHPTVSHRYKYPEKHTNAGRSDMLFAASWPRQLRHFLPEIVAYHLQSVEAPQGANWEGRRTPPFVDDRIFAWFWRWWWRHRCRRHRHHHHHHHHPYLPGPPAETRGPSRVSSWNQ